MNHTPRPCPELTRRTLQISRKTARHNIHACRENHKFVLHGNVSSYGVNWNNEAACLVAQDFLKTTALKRKRVPILNLRLDITANHF